MLHTILHELGHAVVGNRMSDPSDPWNKTYGWSNVDPPAGSGDPPAESSCSLDHSVHYGHDRHFVNSDEATSAAITEAYAHYYAAVTLNRTDEADCFVYLDRQDWDDDGDLDIGRWASCEQRPVMVDDVDMPMPTTMNRDWWDHECAQAVTGVASEYDWLRGLWDLDTDEGYTFTQLVEVLAEAGPTTWIVEPDPLHQPFGGATPPVSACPADFDSGALVDCPYVRMAVDPLGTIRPGWLNQCDNGICR